MIINYPKYKYFYAFADFILIISSFLVSEYLSDIILKPGYVLEIDGVPPSFLWFLFCGFVIIFIMQANGLYHLNILFTRAKHSFKIVKSIIISIVSFIIGTFVFKLDFICDPRLFFLLFIIITSSALIIVRLFIMKKLLLQNRKAGFLKKNVIIIGAGDGGKLTAQKIINAKEYGINIVGFVDDKKEVGQSVIGDLKNMGKILDLHKIRKSIDIDEIILSINNISYERLFEILDQCSQFNIGVKIKSDLFNIIPDKIDVEEYAGIPFVNIMPNVNTKFNYFYKRVFDVVASCFGLIVLSPLLLLIAVLVKLSSKGPIIFRQTRIGKDGEEFGFMKFRSMTIGNEDDKVREKMMVEFMKENKKQFKDSAKIINTNRVTKIGKFIRKTSIDELPQLINVIKGDMSLVGPRPYVPYEYEHFEEWQKIRHNVLPGCTGLWQVSGRGEVSFTDSVLLDIYYTKNMSPWLDMRIILMTIPVMILAKGAK